MKNRSIAHAAVVASVITMIGWNSQSQANVETMISKPAPDFALKSLDGKDVALRDYKGKVVLLDFWAVWCPPCLAALPRISDVAGDPRRVEKGLIVLAVNPGDAVEKVKRIIKPAYKFTTVLDPDQVAFNAYNAEALPSRVIVGRDGKIKFAVEAFSLGEDTEQKLIEALDKELATPAVSK